MKNNLLTEIVENKKRWIEQRMQTEPLSSFKDKISPSQRSFYQALQHQKDQNRCAFILECKKASPSKGLIRQNFDPQSIAQVYQNYATAISVLTDEHYFQGSFNYLD
ncbi:MAG: indole-3-glycerol phosphate synthase TrpC, partial [Saezia sp.]